MSEHNAGQDVLDKVALFLHDDSYVRAAQAILELDPIPEGFRAIADAIDASLRAASSLRGVQSTGKASARELQRAESALRRAESDIDRSIAAMEARGYIVNPIYREREVNPALHDRGLSEAEHDDLGVPNPLLSHRDDSASLRRASLSAADHALSACVLGQSPAEGRAERDARRTAARDLKDHWGRALRARTASAALAELSYAALAARESHGSDEYERRAMRIVEDAVSPHAEHATHGRPESHEARPRAFELNYGEIQDPAIAHEIERQAGEQAQVYRVDTHTGPVEFAYWPGVGRAAISIGPPGSDGWPDVRWVDAPRARSRSDFVVAINDLAMESVSGANPGRPRTAPEVRMMHISHGHYRVSDRDAGALASAAGVSLPREGHAARVHLSDGRLAELLRTTYSRKLHTDAPARGWVWAVMPTGDNPTGTPGTIWVDGSDYVGRASDGTVVTLGNVGREDELNRYLNAHPTPRDW